MAYPERIQQEFHQKSLKECREKSQMGCLNEGILQENPEGSIEEIRKRTPGENSGKILKGYLKTSQKKLPRQITK